MPFKLYILYLVKAETVIIGIKFGFILRLAPSLSCLCDGSLLRLAGLSDFSHGTYNFLGYFYGGKISEIFNTDQISGYDYP